MSEYAAIPSTGKLKIKGVKDSRVDKKKKKKSKSINTEEQEKDNSVVLRKLEEADAKIRSEQRPTNISQLDDRADNPGADEGGDVRDHLKTDAEKRYQEQRRKRLEKKLEKEGVKTHKQRVEELNKYLSNLSEHHDMPKIGPG